MAATPYHYLPRKRFWLRIAAPLVGVYLAGLLITGVLTEVPLARGKSLSGRAQAHQAEFLHRVTHVPEVCWSGNAVNEFQVRQCGEFWRALLSDAGIFSIPWALVVVFYLACMDSLSLLYRRARKRIEKGEALFQGVVTKPSRLPQDFFSWAYCLRPLSVQLPNGRQLRVHLPLDETEPQPGEKVAVFDGGKAFGQTRYLALIYTPHVAVVLGEAR